MHACVVHVRAQARMVHLYPKRATLTLAGPADPADPTTSCSTTHLRLSPVTCVAE